MSDKPKKIESNLLTMTLALVVITLVASAALGYVYTLTKGPIELAMKHKETAALKVVLPEFDNNPLEEEFEVPALDDTTQKLSCYPAKKDGKIVGVAIKTYTDIGFSGHFEVMVGFQPDGTIINSTVLSHQETPGLGDKIDKKKSDWSDQFNGKNPATFKLAVEKDGGDVKAITAATISSRAYTDAIKRAYDAFMQEVKPKLGI